MPQMIPSPAKIAKAKTPAECYQNVSPITRVDQFPGNQVPVQVAPAALAHAVVIR